MDHVRGFDDRWIVFGFIGASSVPTQRSTRGSPSTCWRAMVNTLKVFGQDQFP